MTCCTHEMVYPVWGAGAYETGRIAFDSHFSNSTCGERAFACPKTGIAFQGSGCSISPLLRFIVSVVSDLLSVART